jgi:hypothetical protein
MQNRFATLQYFEKNLLTKVFYKMGSATLENCKWALQPLVYCKMSPFKIRYYKMGSTILQYFEKSPLTIVYYKIGSATIKYYKWAPQP